MPTVTLDDTPLSDDGAIREILAPLNLPHLFPDKLGPELPVPTEIQAMGNKPRAYWTRYLRDQWPEQTWHEKTEVWLGVSKKAGVLRRVVISGLEDEQEAKVLRSEFARRRVTNSIAFTIANIEQLAEEVTSTRERRAYQRNFQSYLQHVRDYFDWENEQVVESGGRLILLPISKSNLRPEDIALLRDVFALLPRTLFDPFFLREDSPRSLYIHDERCPTCGGNNKAKKDSFEDLRTTRKKLTAEVADEGFMAWVSERLIPDKPGKWTRSTELYHDYENWVRTYGNNMGERRQSKAALLSQTGKCGDLMHKLFVRKRSGKGNRYRVTLKRQAVHRE